MNQAPVAVLQSKSENIFCLVCISRLSEKAQNRFQENSTL